MSAQAPQGSDKKRRGRPPKSAEAKLLEVIATLSDEERIKLATEQGIIIPRVTAGGAAKKIWGYLCNHCGEPGLDFIGETFVLEDGTVVDQPPVGQIPVHQLPWTQDRPPALINRSDPKCQACHSQLPRRRMFLMDRYVIKTEAWRRSRDQGQATAKKKMGRPQRSGPVSDHGISSNYDIPGDKVVSDKGLSEMKDIDEAVGIGRALFPNELGR